MEIRPLNCCPDPEISAELKLNLTLQMDAETPTHKDKHSEAKQPEELQPKMFPPAGRRFKPLTGIRRAARLAGR